MVAARRTSMGVQQKLMRHAQIATTTNVYGEAMMESKRAVGPPDATADSDQMFPGKLTSYAEAGESAAFTSTQRWPRPADVGWDAA